MNVDNPGRSLSLRREFSSNRESNSTNSPPVIDCLVFQGMEQQWRKVTELVKSSFQAVAKVSL